ncbi:hypothetical protein HMPREF0591_5312 [Mycobacterium parascrofulaceum ATCC BAA-614]|uniref:Uncharacterized protein n=1 Tax=Mycobacterium parascrofulaceum ATCC BAA-614 TaxID=525368 RepID=D5PGL8_9MYCO|nr:hypothetical protein HMPREF0591_5312 [Mycobacterium parascrofulaceum ATCC BAA-614]
MFKWGWPTNHRLILKGGETLAAAKLMSVDLVYQNGNAQGFGL